MIDTASQISSMDGSSGRFHLGDLMTRERWVEVMRILVTGVRGPVVLARHGLAGVAVVGRGGGLVPAGHNGPAGLDPRARGRHQNFFDSRDLGSGVWRRRLREPCCWDEAELAERRQ